MWFWPEITQKRQKTGSCKFRRYQMWISLKSPKLDHLTSVFEQFLAKPHLVARQNVTFWTFGKLHFFIEILTHCLAHTINGALRGRSLRSQRFKSCNCFGSSERISEATSIVTAVRGLAVGSAKVKLTGLYGGTMGG